MKSSVHGKRTSAAAVEILNISPHAVWLAVAEREYLLPSESFPWFRDATVAEIGNVELHHGRHLHWPDLDVDLELESLERPELYPLVARKRRVKRRKALPSGAVSRRS
jgi:hypothetical protein